MSSTRRETTIQFNAVGGSQEPIHAMGPSVLGASVLITSGAGDQALCLHGVAEGYSGPPVEGRWNGSR